ncbi:unnamed protein product [Gordionus sp. m RMFG-2023]
MSSNNHVLISTIPQPYPQNHMKNALKHALGGGLTGSMAMACQVTSLMWMRTVMNYQYRFVDAGNFFTAARKLIKEGGIIRLYRGYPQAMLQAPASRFGDAAANEVVMALTEKRSSHTKHGSIISDTDDHWLSDLPIAVKTGMASVMAAVWRIGLMPIDAWKTVKQVEGLKGSSILLQKVKTHGPKVLYHGVGATFAATLAGHYPWFVTYNYLSLHLPKPVRPNISSDVVGKEVTPINGITGIPKPDFLPFSLPTINLKPSPNLEFKMKELSRQAFIGFMASVVSDTVTNSLRVIKTVKQTSGSSLSYRGVMELIKKDSAKGGKSVFLGGNSIFMRGLGTRIAVNGLQGLTFSVLWKVFMDYYKTLPHMQQKT